MRKNMLIIALVLFGIGLVAATDTMIWALWHIKDFFCTIIPTIMLVCFLLAAIVYAAGQMASADQRARFHGWATSLLIGAITCGVMYILGPWIITLFMPNNPYTASVQIGQGLCG
jgi:uncharacterized membrane protein YcjF (UPF0283 family)